jgi:hypothetical protein
MRLGPVGSLGAPWKGTASTSRQIPPTCHSESALAVRNLFSPRSVGPYRADRAGSGCPRSRWFCQTWAGRNPRRA